MHKKFLQQAIALAVDNVTSGAGGPYGAIIVRECQLIAASGNKVTCTIDPTAHAEIAAIRLACLKLNDFQLHDCILYTSCEPCPMCLGAIYRKGGNRGLHRGEASLDWRRSMGI